MQGTRTCKTYEHAFQFQDIRFLWATRGQHSGQFIGALKFGRLCYQRSDQQSDCFDSFLCFFVALMFICMFVTETGSCEVLVDILFVSRWWDARVFFLMFLEGVHCSRALDAAQGMFHMDSSEFPYRQFSSRDLTEEDKV